MVSAFELIYYLTVGLAMHLYDNHYYGVLTKHLKMQWHSFKKYLKNEVGNLADIPANQKGKLRHPSDHRKNAW